MADEPRNRPPDLRELTLAEMQEQTRILKALLRLLDEATGAYLNARFPYGNPSDRWPRRG